jgi:uncharacterized membrane protein YeiH
LCRQARLEQATWSRACTRLTVTRSSFHYNPNQLLLAVDLLGTLVFAIEGALAAIKGDLDFFGLMVLSFITAVGGGILRDLLIGDVPPNSIRDWRYGVTAFAVGAARLLLL